MYCYGVVTQWGHSRLPTVRYLGRLGTPYTLICPLYTYGGDIMASYVSLHQQHSWL